MSNTVAKTLAAVDRMTVRQLRDKYAEVFGEATAANNRAWLVRRIAWRVQALAEGGLTERALARAAELARDADLRLSAPRAAKGAAEPAPAPRADDSRLPPPGSVITRRYKGGVVQVRVLADGFECAGEVYKSLSAVAKAVTGSHCNGYLFFRLARGGAA